MEHESDGDTNCHWCARYSHQRIGTGTGGLRNKRTSETIQATLLRSTRILRRVLVTWRVLLLLKLQWENIIRRDSVSFLRFIFLSHVPVFSCEISLVCAWKLRTMFFFPSLVSSYCCSVDSCIVCAASGYCDQSFFAIFMWSSRRLIEVLILSWILACIGQMSWGFANGPGRPRFNPMSSHTQNYEMVLDAAMLDTQNYKVRIKGKVEQSRKWSNALSYTSAS